MAVCDVNINEITISDECPFSEKGSIYSVGFKYFLYKNNNKVLPLSVLLPKMSGYMKTIEDGKTIHLLVKHE